MEHTVVADLGGRVSGEAGFGPQEGHQDLRAKGGLVKGCRTSGHLVPGFAGTHPRPAPATGCGIPAQPPAASADWWTPSSPAAPPSIHRSSG